jgi:hypothetical protein
MRTPNRRPTSRGLGRKIGAGLGLAVALIGGASAGCSRSAKPLRVVAREELLRRQVEDLRLLVARAERGSVVPTGALSIVVDEQLAQELLQLTLPREHAIDPRFVVRIERVNVRFSEGLGLVELHGRVSWRGEGAAVAADVYADLTVFARVGAVGVDSRAGTLTAEVSPYGFEIHELRIGEDSPASRRFVEGVADALPGALAGLATPLTLPVAVEHEFLVEEASAGPVRISQVAVALRASVVEAGAHGGRLWIALALAEGAAKKADR